MAQFSPLSDIEVSIADRHYTIDRDARGAIDVYCASKLEVTGALLTGSLAGEARWLPSRGCVDRDAAVVPAGDWDAIEAAIRRAEST